MTNIKLCMNGIKIGMCFSYLTGSCLCLIPNKISLQIDKKKFNNIEIPIIGGCLGVLGILSSPFLITNYLFNGIYFDKLYDKYDIDIKRYHQYDGNDNKYAYPSIIQVKINKKEL